MSAAPCTTHADGASVFYDEGEHYACTARGCCVPGWPIEWADSVHPYGGHAVCAKHDNPKGRAWALEGAKR